MYRQYQNSNVKNKLKNLVASYHSFLFILITYNYTHIHSIRSSVTFAEHHSIYFIAVRSVEDVHLHAKPKIEFGAVVQQPDALPSELRYTLKIKSAKL
jgi:hypothetical protein